MKSSVDSCLELREYSAAKITEIFQPATTKSESAYADEIKTKLYSIDGVLPFGWYAPPPSGIGVLFGEPTDDYQRIRFDTFRNEQYWPSSNYDLAPESVAILYASPIWANSGIIGDWGVTLYRGRNSKIQKHIRTCLETVEQLAEFSQAGMKYGDISRYADRLLSDEGLSTDRTLLINKPDAIGTNCGHTIPWTSEKPTATEAAILESRDQAAICKLISSKRIYVNADETTKIPETGAFTAELRLESLAEPSFPNTFFHLIVTFTDGNKTIASNFNEFFKATGMNYIHSKY